MLSTRFHFAADNFEEFADSGRTDSSEVLIIIRADTPRNHGWLVLLTVLTSAAGCRAPIDSDLLDVSGLGSARVEPGDRLSIEGAGFPAGREATVRFEGQLHRPGARDLEIRHALRGRAVAPDLIELMVDDEMIASLGGRGTFEGLLRISFEAADGDSTVSGSLERARLDLLPRSRERVGSVAARGRRSRETSARLGMELAETASHETGMRVSTVRAGGPAMLAGVEVGDTIETIDGLQLASADELLAAPEATETRLGVRKPGDAAAIERTLRTAPVAAPPPRTGGDELLLILLLGGLAIFLLLSAPTARLTELITREPQRESGGLLWLSDAGHLPEGSTLLRRMATALSASLALALIIGLSELGRRIGIAHYIGVLLIAILSLQLISSLASRRGRLLAELLTFAAGAIPLLVATAGAILLLAAQPEAGAAAPWRWSLFANPVAMLLFVAFCVSGLGGLPADPRGSLASQSLARAHLLLVACLGAPLFLGGLEPPLEALGEPLAMVGWLSLRSALLVLLGGWLLRRLPSRAEARSRASIPFAFAGLVGSIAWLGWERAADVSAISGPLLSGTFLVVSLSLLIGGRRARPPELRLHPFL